MISTRVTGLPQFFHANGSGDNPLSTAFHSLTLMSRPQPKGSENPLPDWSARFSGLECEFVTNSETGVRRFALWNAREASKDGTEQWIKCDKTDVIPLADAV